MSNNNNAVAVYIRDDNIQKRIADLLKNRAPQFTTSLITSVNENKKLAECEPQSVVTAALTAASMDLPINQNLGFAYLIPYNGKGGNVCQFQMGYKGFIQLAQRSGYYKTINVTDVRDGEIVNIDRLSGEIAFDWIENDKQRAKTQVIGYVAFFELLNGFKKSLYMSAAQIDSHAKRFSKSYKYGSGLWKDDFDSMAKKTVLKQLISKYGPLNTQLQEAVVKDQTVDGEYVDNPEYSEPIEIEAAEMGESEDE
jgi:recombination protein RecT